MTTDRAALLSDEELLGALAASFPVDPVEPDAAQLYRLSMAVGRASREDATTPAHRRHAAPAALDPAPPVQPGRARRRGNRCARCGHRDLLRRRRSPPGGGARRRPHRGTGQTDDTDPTTLPAATSPSPTAAATAARQAESTLHQALTQSNPPPAVISHDSAVLAHRLIQVGGHPTAGAAGTTADGQHLLNEACRQLEGSGQATTGSSTSGTAGTAGPPSPAAGPSGSGTTRRGRRPRAPRPASPPPPPARRTCRRPRIPVRDGRGPVQGAGGGIIGDLSRRNPDRRAHGDHARTVSGSRHGRVVGGPSRPRDLVGPAVRYNENSHRTQNSRTENASPGATDPRSGATSG
jgi:hypothetical protein